MGSRTESKAEKERQKQIQEKCQTILTQLLRDEDNKYCVDCDAKGPRWASWNIGVFLCIRCAGIHRNLGVHISKVKSVNLDSWTPEQVVSLQQMGNSRARAVYEATLPDTWRRPQTDSSLETFIRAKYQHKRYIAKEWVPSPIPKVDWDKELDEEAEKQKKKKKEKQQQSSSSLPPLRKAELPAKVPAIPKPVSSPKSSRAASSAPADNSYSKSSSADLLGLSTPAVSVPSNNGEAEDVFSSFLSAPPAPSTATAVAESVVKSEELASTGRSSEEDSFFNQPSPASAVDPKKPLSKDSILALYSSQSTVQPQPTIFHAPGIFPTNQSLGYSSMANPTFPPAAQGGFPSGFLAQPGGFPTQMAPNAFMNSGHVPGLFTPPSQMPPQAHTGVTGCSQMGFLPSQVSSSFPNGVQAGLGPNPFVGMSMGLPPAQGFPVQHGSQPNASDDLLGDFSSTGKPSLPLQMSGLNLNGTAMGAQPVNAVFGSAPFAAMTGVINPSAPAGMGQTFTTHLWQ